MRTTALHNRFGIEIHDVDLSQITAESGYPTIREAFETHSVLLFRNQDLDDARHIAFGELFGPIEDRSRGANGSQPSISLVTNIKDDNTVASASDLQVLNLKANQLWHTDSTFLPVPALANVITARVVTSTGGETELVSSRIAWQDMPADLKSRARDAVLWHRCSHSRAKISEELATEEMYSSWEDRAWRAVWPNPFNGEEALYIASHAFAVAGMENGEGQGLIDALMAWATRDKYVYSHRWRPGDVLVWDERATLHRGRPWPYEEERSLASICISARDQDGLSLVRPPHPQR